MATATITTYLVIADEDHKDVVLGTYETLEAARTRVDVYNDTHREPFCWIEANLHSMS